MTSKTFAAQRRFLSQMVVQEEREEPKDNDALLRMANASGRQGGAADNVMDVVEQQQRFRPLVIQSNPFKGCTGSATVEMGKTRVSCTVIGPREHQASETVLEGVLNISLQGSIDLALRYSIEHALQAVVCLKKLARTEVNVELNVLADDGGALAACMLAAGVAIGSANIEIFDLVLACNLLILSQPSDSETPQFILDPDQATICAHMDRAATLTMAIVPSIGQVILTELGGFPLPHRLVRRAMPLAFNHCASLFPSVRDALLQNVDDECGPTI